MITKSPRLSLLFALAFVGSSVGFRPVAEAQSQTFSIPESGASKAIFISDAPLETMKGETSSVSGQISFDPANIAGVKGSFKVPVTTIRTGSDLRDEHLAGDGWLDAKKHPYATFEISKLVKGPDELNAGKNAKVKVQGKFTVHGVTKDVVADGTVRWEPSDKEALRIQASFKIALEDHEVSVPTIVRLKVANEIAVKVDLRGVADKPQQRLASE
jgi:polyisoprenoid-binding protein YceI